MSLTEYKKKRKLRETPEPKGGLPGDDKLHFVVQKHEARSLHYDFRLEVGGVLKSWAVPKGPSMNPADKRLAMQVEDHPYDYLDFEGVIPEDNYGAGTMIVWDQGTFETLEKGNKIAQIHHLKDSLKKGSVKIKLKGEKLKGEFALVRTPRKAENTWLLFKNKDPFAIKRDIKNESRSVISGKTLEELAQSGNVQSNIDHQTAEVKQTAPENEQIHIIHDEDSQAAGTGIDIKELDKYDTTDLPEDLDPMLATLVKKPVEGDWIYELKWDGYRALAYHDKDFSELRSRNNNSFNEKFYPVFNALTTLPNRVMLDGEIVVLNDKGLPDFSALQSWRSEADGRLVYFVFDLLWLEGKDIRKAPLKERRSMLKQVLPQSEMIRMSEDFDVEAKDFFSLIEKMGLEGMLAKKSDSIYQTGARSKDWLKIKAQKFQQAVIGGYTINENTSRKFSALLLGLHENGKFVYAGSVGTGFTAKMQDQILKRLEPLKTEQCPFIEVPEYNKPSRFRPNPPKAEVNWVKPEVIAEISFRTVAPDGSFRHPSFKGLHEDRVAAGISREKAKPVQDLTDAKPAEFNRMMGKGQPKARKTLLNPADETQTRTIGGHDLKFTNLSKIFWLEQLVTKRDMLNYYYQMAPFIVPYLKNRPQTLSRYPNGIKNKSFYQKDVTGKVPDWLESFPYFSEKDQRKKHFAVCTDEASLLYLASLACIEMNPWSSTTQNPDHPDWCIIDLDPDQNPFEQVIEAARATKEVLDAIDLPGCCKTSGSTGLHIYIPLGANYTYEESKEFGRSLVKVIHRHIPDFTSIERLKSNRKGNIYLDFLQNRPQATVAAPYSLRPRPGAPVSMPLHWSEVKPGLKISDFNIFNSVERVNEQGDIFSGVLGAGIDMQAALEKLQRVK